MRTAKELFQSSPAAAEWQKVVASASFEPACHAALGALIEDMPRSAADMSKAWDAYLIILGARRFIEKLSRLHEPEEEAKQAPWPTLNYDKKSTSV